jgi:hypothetical protein
MFPIDVTGFPEQEYGLTAEQFLRRLPPLGWRGAECTSGQVIGRSDRVTVFLDRVFAFSAGIEFWLCFYTVEPKLRTALNRHPIFDHAQRVFDQADLPDAQGPEARRLMEMMLGPDEPRPVVEVILPDEGVLEPEPVVPAPGTQFTRGPSLALVRSVETGGGAMTWMLYLQPVPTTGETLTIRLTWPSADFAEAQVALDLGEIRSNGGNATQIIEVGLRQGPQ